MTPGQPEMDQLISKDTASGNILHVTHTWGGGISTYIDDLEEIFRGKFNFFILFCFGGMLNLRYEDDRKKKNIYYRLSKSLRLTDFTHQEYHKIFSLILRAFNIDVVHINTSLGHTFDVFKAPAELGIPVVYTIHDFFYICPTCHLVDNDGIYCNVCKPGEEREACLKKHHLVIDKDLNKEDLKRWRTEFENVKKNVDLFISPSASAKKIFSSFFNIEKSKFMVIYHGTHVEKQDFPPALEMGQELRVGILGLISRHKGKSLIKYILKNINDNSIKFYLFGKSDLKSSNLKKMGIYDRSNIVGQLRENRINIMLILSTWPETFSYTLSESILAGIPIIATNLGALKERVERDNIGWIVDYKKPDDICLLLRHLNKNRNEINKCSEMTKHVHIKTFREMQNEYRNVYSLLISKKTASRLNVAEREKAIYELNKFKLKTSVRRAIHHIKLIFTRVFLKLRSLRE